MKHACLFLLSATLLAACGDASETVADDAPAVADVETVIATPPASVAEDGTVVLTVDRLISEDAACLLMIDVVNGLERPVTAGLFAFNVTGNGQTAGANMFPQTAEPGDSVTAQIVLPNVDCADAVQIQGGQVNCRIAGTEESCIEDLELRDGAVDFALGE